MASEYLGVPEDIDDQILDFVAGRAGVTVEMVLRDITRIATIVKLVKESWLDGDTAVLCGGMAMRCLESPGSPSSMGFDALSFLIGDPPAVADMAHTIDVTIIRRILAGTADTGSSER